MCTSLSSIINETSGNAFWVLKNGLAFGETHTAVITSENGIALISHPIDVHYECDSTDGWPLFVCEVIKIFPFQGKCGDHSIQVWDRSLDPVRNFFGCGSAWLPASKSCVSQPLDVFLWRPSQTRGLQFLQGKFSFYNTVYRV